MHLPTGDAGLLSNVLNLNLLNLFKSSVFHADILFNQVYKRGGENIFHVKNMYVLMIHVYLSHKNHGFMA